MSIVLSVNVGLRAPNPAGTGIPSGMRKHPVDGPVLLRDPGDKRTGDGSGVVGDFVGNRRHHGGTFQAVYAVSREELDVWAADLGRDLPAGAFGENLTTEGLDVDAALVGEIWQVGPVVRLKVTGPRIPCRTFASAMGVRGWVPKFTRRGRTGAYLQVLTPGEVAAGDSITVEHRPEHSITVPLLFAALTTDRSLMPRLLEAGDDLPADTRAEVERYLAKHHVEHGTRGGEAP